MWLVHEVKSLCLNFYSDMPGQEISRGESVCDPEFLKLFTFNNVGC
jgi:hypothetical protein